MAADPATEDLGDLVGLSNRLIGIEQPYPKVFKRRTAMKDQVVGSADAAYRRNAPGWGGSLVRYLGRQARPERPPRLDLWPATSLIIEVPMGG